MRKAPFTEADVNNLISEKKYFAKKREDNRRQPNITEVRLTYEVRKRGEEDTNLRLQFYARLEIRPNSAVVQARPGVSLLWYGHRIRCLCWKLRRDVIQNRERVGFVTGWYEHRWTDIDRDEYVVDVDDSEIIATDFDSVVRVCCARWNIEMPGEQLTFGELP